ncbi:MAG: 1-acyl-sn-glycerol-3-phosphate acyltransferase [Candidatus Fermentibacteraceae bacterium]|nr:1-acyl-sn-glycerol-3-phosphate acyltransferase [Candidatus Fermentibacteraceae bacterium]
MKRSILVDIILRPVIITLSVVFFRMKVVNRRNIPKDGVIIAGNHISNWDPPFIAAAVPRAVHFMAKSSLFKTRFLSWFMQKLGAFPINRRSAVNSGALNTAIDLVNRGAAVIIFPEGTRSKNGKLLPAKPGVGYIAHATGAPVLPFFMEGMDDPLATLFFKSRFKVTFGQLISPGELEEQHKQGGPGRSAGYILEKVREIKDRNEQEKRKDR